MNTRETRPPRWAEAMLRASLRPSDREAVSGDLLEEYRATRQPALGTFRADLWYVRHAVSVLWHLMRPFALLLAALIIVSMLFNGINLWYGSLAQAPGLSLVHALVYAWAGYHGSRRTRSISSGMLAAGGTGLVGFTVFFAAAAIAAPGLILAPFAKPFIFVILSVLLLLALGFAVLVGAIGGTIGRWLAPAAPREARLS